MAPIESSGEPPILSERFAPDKQFRMQLRTTLIEKGGGSFLRGWRREMDPDGVLDISQADYRKAAVRLGLDPDEGNFFVTENILSLEELSPAAGQLLNRFRMWGKATFGSASRLFAAFDTDTAGKVTFTEFVAGCRRHQFSATEDEAIELYNCIDTDAKGSIAVDDVMFLEPPSAVRDSSLHSKKPTRKDQHLRNMAAAYSQDAKMGVSDKDRRARRPWQAEFFESLPSIACQRRVERQIYLAQKRLEARVIFVRHLREMYKCEVRAWRRGLAPEGAFKITQTELLQYCRKVDLTVDTGALWKSLDRDVDGYLRLEELDVVSADVLATFAHWARQEAGSCGDLWYRPELQKYLQNQKAFQGGRWVSDKKILVAPFLHAMQGMGWAGARDADARNIVTDAMDPCGCGFLSHSDLQWLDGWSPSEWLIAEPDPAAWEEIRGLMMKTYNHPLRAWRCLLDADNSNKVSWPEFRRACSKLRYTGNTGGAWRHLDEGLTGAITMKEYDAESAELLGSFKAWCDDNFGSVRVAWKVLDAEGGGTLTFSDLRKACRKFNWPGEVRLLFDCLDVDRSEDKAAGKRALALKEISFLDSWEYDATSNERAKLEEALAGPRQPRGGQRACIRISQPAAGNDPPEAADVLETTLPAEDPLSRKAKGAPTPSAVSTRPSTSTSEARPPTRSGSAPQLRPSSSGCGSLNESGLGEVTAASVGNSPAATPTAITWLPGAALGGASGAKASKPGRGPEKRKGAKSQAALPGTPGKADQVVRIYHCVSSVGVPSRRPADGARRSRPSSSPAESRRSASGPASPASDLGGARQKTQTAALWLWRAIAPHDAGDVGESGAARLDSVPKGLRPLASR